MDVSETVPRERFPWCAVPLLNALPLSTDGHRVVEWPPVAIQEEVWVILVHPQHRAGVQPVNVRVDSQIIWQLEGHVVLHEPGGFLMEDLD